MVIDGALDHLQGELFSAAVSEVPGNHVTRFRIRVGYDRGRRLLVELIRLQCAIQTVNHRLVFHPQREFLRLPEISIPKVVCHQVAIGIYRPRIQF